MFPMTVTLTIHNAAMLAALHAMSAGNAVADLKPQHSTVETAKPAAENAKTEEPPKAKKPAKKEEAAPTQPTAAEEKVDAPAPKAENSDAKPASDPAAEAPATKTYEDCAPLVIKLAQTPGKGRDAVVAVLSKFGVPQLKAATPEQFGAIFVALEAALAAPAEAAGPAEV